MQLSDFIDENEDDLRKVKCDPLLNGVVKFLDNILCMSTNRKEGRQSKKQLTVATKEFLESLCDYMEVSLEIRYKEEEKKDD